MSIDLAAILMNAMHDINQMRRDSMKPKLGNLAKLANDVPPNAPLLFGSEEDLSKRISKIMTTNTAVTKIPKGKFSKNFRKPHPPISLPLWDEGSERGKSQGTTKSETIYATKLPWSKLASKVSSIIDLNLHFDIAKFKFDIANHKACNIQKFSSNLAEVSPNAYIMQIVRKGLTIDFIGNMPPITNSIKQCVFAPNESALIDLEILTLLKKGVICKSARGPGIFSLVFSPGLKKMAPVA